jgi:hypothetical protein
VTPATVALAGCEETAPRVPFVFPLDRLVSSEEANPIVLPFAVGNVLPRSVVYPVWRLGRLSLRRPIVVTVEHDEDQIIVSSEALRIWGSGETKYDALADFGRTFLELLNTYANTPAGEMTQGATRYLRQLESFLPNVA